MRNFKKIPSKSGSPEVLRNRMPKWSLTAGAAASYGPVRAVAKPPHIHIYTYIYYIDTYIHTYICCIHVYVCACIAPVACVRLRLFALEMTLVNMRAQVDFLEYTNVFFQLQLFKLRLPLVVQCLAITLGSLATLSTIARCEMCAYWTGSIVLRQQPLA